MGIPESARKLTITPDGRCGRCDGVVVRARTIDREAGTATELICRSCARTRWIGQEQRYAPARPVATGSEREASRAHAARRREVIADLLERGRTGRQIYTSLPQCFAGMTESAAWSIISTAKPLVAERRLQRNRDQARIRMRQQTAQRLQAGLCTRCGLRPPETNARTCRRCYQARSLTRYGAPVTRPSGRRRQRRSWAAARNARAIIKACLLEGLSAREIVQAFPDEFPHGWCKRASTAVSQACRELHRELARPEAA